MATTTKRPELGPRYETVDQRPKPLVLSRDGWRSLVTEAVTDEAADADLARRVWRRLAQRLEQLNPYGSSSTTPNSRSW